MNWNERSAIVTGGAGGLGAATVRRLTGLGLRVVVFDRALDAGTDTGRPSWAAVPPWAGTSTMTTTWTPPSRPPSALAPLAVVVNVAGGGRGGRTLSRDNEPLDIEPPSEPPSS